MKRRILATILSFALLFSLSTTTYASTATPITTDDTEYVENLLSVLEGKDVTVSPNPEVLYDLSSDSVCAVLYTVNSDGYAILNLSDLTVSEYALDTPSHYEGVSGKKYYAGIFQYYAQQGGNIISLPEGSIMSTTQLATISASYRADYPTISSNEKSTRRSQFNNELTVSPRIAPRSNSLPYSLTTTYVNGKCAPTAMATMLWYYGSHVNSSYKGGHSSVNSLISTLEDYVTPAYNASVIASGCNDYFEDYMISNHAYSCSYDFDRVMSCIDWERPITVGGDASAFDESHPGGGHIGVVHGYSYVPNPGYHYYVLKVNDGWGHNNVSIAYYGTPPSTLVDHIYFAS